MEQLAAYIPMDRRQAMRYDIALPDEADGAALFADISGFTKLTEALATVLGARRGAEELTYHLNRVYDAVISDLHLYGGAVMMFSGDAITCWFEGDDGLRAVACALRMQQTMQQFTAVSIPNGEVVSLSMKTAVSVGPARRFIVGDPTIQLIDTICGNTLDRLAAAEGTAEKGELVVDEETAHLLQTFLEIETWRQDENGRSAAVVQALRVDVPPTPWRKWLADDLSKEELQPWLLRPVFDRLISGGGDFLAELRPAVVALFLRFTGIDYDNDQDAGQKLDTFVREAQAIFSKYSSYLLQLTIGDKGSYIYGTFGAPISHEDDAVRGARAALELQQLAEKLSFINEVQIGLTQGRARTGAYGGALRRTYGVLGDAVNLSARLMQAAQPGQILATAQIVQQTESILDWTPLPKRQVKGKSDFVEPYRLDGVKQNQAFQIQVPRYSMQMVGRQAELKVIIEKLQLAMAGQGQIVGISGEAGIGKSRLVAEVVRIAESQQIVRYGGECQSYGTNSSYLVWESVWRGLFQIHSAQSTETQINKLQSWVQETNESWGPRLPLFSSLLNLPIPDNELTGQFDAKLRKVSLESLLVSCLQALTADQPHLLVLEDVHWMDPLSADLLLELSRAIVDLPVLILLAYRPVDAGAFDTAVLTSHDYFTELHLENFSRTDSEQLVMQKLLDAPVTEALMREIMDRAQGNPFYIEELLNYLRDQQINVNDVATWSRQSLPTSLQSLILSRIDQLAEQEQTTLKVASVIGRLFNASMVYGIYPQLNEQDALTSLERLSQLDMTIRETESPELAYLFKNIVTREVAYENLPFATRAMLHEAVGTFIESQYPGLLEQYVDLLAHHFSHSRNEEKQRIYLAKAGEMAQKAYANESAIAYYEQLIPLLDAQAQVDIMLKAGKVNELLGQWSAAAKYYQNALQAAERLGDETAVAWSQTAIGELFRKQGQFDEATKWLILAQDNFKQLGDQAGVGQTLHFGGTLSAQQGNLEKAKRLYEKSLEIRRDLGDLANEAAVLSNLAIVARYLGDADKSRQLNEEALQLRRQIGDRWAISVSLNNLGNAALDQADYETARRCVEEAVAIQREVGDRSAIAISLNNLGNVVRSQGEYELARRLYIEGMGINEELGDKWAMAYLLEDMGCLAVLEENPARAFCLVAAAERLRQEIGAPLSKAEESKLEAFMHTARETLTAVQVSEAKGAGHALSLNQAIEYAIGQPAAI